MDSIRVCGWLSNLRRQFLNQSKGVSGERDKWWQVGEDQGAGDEEEEAECGEEAAEDVEGGQEKVEGGTHISIPNINITFPFNDFDVLSGPVDQDIQITFSLGRLVLLGLTFLDKIFTNFRISKSQAKACQDLKWCF